MRQKRNVMLDRIFNTIANSDDISTVNRLYKEGLKGSAVAKQLRKITYIWNEKVAKVEADGDKVYQESLGFRKISF
jgi:hypothetical protein